MRGRGRDLKEESGGRNLNRERWMERFKQREVVEAIYRRRGGGNDLKEEMWREM